MSLKSISIVAGGAGFIGTSLVNKLMDLGTEVIVMDNFSMMTKANFLKLVSIKPENVLTVDLANKEDTLNSFSYCFNKFDSINDVWHMAANSDIPAGVEDSTVDLKDTFLTTFSLLKACQEFQISNFHFASSSAVYGDWGKTPLAESLGPLTPISNYGAMKLASEAQICAAREAFLKHASIFRFPNVIGVPATHGVIYDFIHKLNQTPNTLDVLGDGSQQKSYIHVSELVDAMYFISNHIDTRHEKKPYIINIGNNDSGVSVKEIAETVVSKYSPDAKIKFGNVSYGWVGDIPKFQYDTRKLNALGWSPKMTSKEAIILAVDEISSQLMLLNKN